MKQDKFKSYFATAVVFVLVAFLLYTVYVFINGFFGGLLLYVLLLPLYTFLTKKGFSKKISAWAMVLIGIFVILIPLLFILSVVGNQLFSIFQNPSITSNITESVSSTLTKIIPSLNQNDLNNQILKLGGLGSSLFLNIASNVGTFTINLMIAFFILYFMLIASPLYNKIEKIIPFNKKNSKKIINKLRDVSYATIFVSGIIAIIQGLLLTLSFIIFEIKGAFLWGFVTAIISFLPVIGPPFIWIPAAIIQFIQGDNISGYGILIFGLILSSIDNLIRPYLGKRISRIHPLVTLIGVFIGIYLFGLIGIFVGPLLLSLSILIIKMFKEEYF